MKTHGCGKFADRVIFFNKKPKGRGWIFILLSRQNENYDVELLQVRKANNTYRKVGHIHKILNFDSWGKLWGEIIFEAYGLFYNLQMRNITEEAKKLLPNSLN